MARILIVGCGCRGRELAQTLLAAGHSVRGTTRDPHGGAEMVAAGVEPYVGDPNRIASLVGALPGVTILCWLLASARGDAEQLSALHGSRLQRMLEEVVDSPLRGFVYEATGTVDPAILQAGTRIVGEAQRTWRIPMALIRHDPAADRGLRGAVHATVASAPSAAPDGWLDAARAAVLGLLET